MHIFTNEKFNVLTWISFKFIPKVPIYNKSAFVQVMAWRRTGDKPLSEPLLTHFIDAYAALEGDENDKWNIINEPSFIDTIELRSNVILKYRFIAKMTAFHPIWYEMVKFNLSIVVKIIPTTSRPKQFGGGMAMNTFLGI